MAPTTTVTGKRKSRDTVTQPKNNHHHQQQQQQHPPVPTPTPTPQALDSSSDDDDEQGFPELDLGESDEWEEDENDNEEDEEELLKALQEEEGSNVDYDDDDDDGDEDDFSSDNDDEDDESSSSSSPPQDLLTRLISKHSSKPTEDDPYYNKKNGKPFGSKDFNGRIEENRGVDIKGKEIGGQSGFMSRAKKVRSKATGMDKLQWDEEIEPGYGSESSTEDVQNRIGNLPTNFYHLDPSQPHIGYNINGEKILKPSSSSSSSKTRTTTFDRLDKFLDGLDDEFGEGDGWNKVFSKLEGKEVILSERELELVKRLVGGENMDPEGVDPYEPTIEWFTSKVMKTPLTGAPEPKRRFLPSKWEHKRVMKIVRAIRAGRILPRGSSTGQEDSGPRYYSLWSTSDQPPSYNPMHMPPPPLPIPTHSESYNPPEEYLLNSQELKQWNETDPSDRKMDYLPQKHSSLRRVGAWDGFVKERFERCLDLYLAPRSLRKKKRLEDVKESSDLLPKLPDPEELKPFPTRCAYKFVHGDKRVRCVAIDPLGIWILTGGEDGVVKLWEAATGRETKRWKVAEEGPVYGVAWCPDKSVSLFAVASSGKISLISPITLLSPSLADSTKTTISRGFTAKQSAAAAAAPEEEEKEEGEESSSFSGQQQLEGVRWSRPEKKSSQQRDDGFLIDIYIPGNPKQVVWHKRGDYFATMASEAAQKGVLIHQLSKHHTQAPFTRIKGDVQRVLFHPLKPQFFVATQRQVRIYDLMRQQLVKTVQPSVKWISSIDVHSLGDNIIVGSYDKRLVWHDLDLGERPYRTLRYHDRAVRQVAFSPHYPLFLSSSDDGSIQIFHATVYSDLLTNPLIVPLKILKGHSITEGLGVLDAVWHPREPWVVSVGADGVGKLWMP